MRHEPIDLPRSLGSVIRNEPAAPAPAGPKAGDTVVAPAGGSTLAHGFEFVSLYANKAYRWMFDGVNWVGVGAVA